MARDVTWHEQDDVRRSRPTVPRMSLPAPTSRLVATLAVTALVLTACESGGDAEQAAPPEPSATPTATAEPSPEEEVSPTPAEPPRPSPSEDAVAAEEDGYTVEAPRATEVLAERDEPLRFDDPWEPAPDPAALAERIRAAEQAARDESLTADQRETAGFEAQMRYRQLTRTPAWLDAVLDALPEDLRPAARGAVEAREALDRLLGERDEPATTVPAWRIVEPAPADELVGYYKEAAAEIGVEWEYLAAINLVETRMGRIRGFSTAGARGPMQVIPESWAIFGEGDIDDERDSIFAAARHLKQRDWDKGPRAALLRYNRSSNYGDAVIAYAEVLQQDPDAYDTYHGFQVLYQPGDDVFVFPVGYEEPEPVPLDQYRERPVVEVSG